MAVDYDYVNSSTAATSPLSTSDSVDPLIAVIVISACELYRPHSCAKGSAIHWPPVVFFGHRHPQRRRGGGNFLRHLRTVPQSRGALDTQTRIPRYSFSKPRRTGQRDTHTLTPRYCSSKSRHTWHRDTQTHWPRYCSKFWRPRTKFRHPAWSRDDTSGHETESRRLVSRPRLRKRDHTLETKFWRPRPECWSRDTHAHRPRYSSSKPRRTCAATERWRRWTAC